MHSTNRIYGGIFMKKILSFLIAGIMACSSAGCSQKNANPISLPEESTIQSIDVTVGEETEKYSDSEWISQCISSMNNAQATAKESVQDIPQADEYIKIDINTEDAKSTLFVYLEKNDYYIEQPYQGIYKTDSAFYQTITGNH